MNYTAAPYLSGIDPTGLVEATFLIDQELAADGDVNFYYYTSASPWQLSTVELTTTASGSSGDLTGVVSILRDGPNTLVEIAAAVREGLITTPVLLGATNTAVVGIEDDDGLSSGNTSRYALLWNQVTLPGTMYPPILADSLRQIALEDPPAPGVGGVTQTTLNAVAGGATIAEVRLALDIAHPHTNELTITLISPANKMIVVKTANPGPAGDAVGLIEAYSPDATGTVTVAGLTALIGDPVSGTWILQVDDTVPGDAGVIRGWSLFIVPQ